MKIGELKGRDFLKLIDFTGAQHLTGVLDRHG